VSSPIPETALPYGIRDIKLVGFTNQTATVRAGVMVDLPNAQTLAFTEQEEFQELRGDDSVVTTRGNGAQGEWSTDSGGISFAAHALIVGGVVTETGVTPNVKRKLRKRSTDVRPFFLAMGQIISDSGGDFHAYLYRCRSTGDVEVEFSDGEFMVPSLSGAMLKSLVPFDDGALYDLIMNESVTALAIPPSA
jgi:hypothetical protein